MSKLKITVGAILENRLRQFCKVISVRNGVYGLSGWTTRAHAEKATITQVHLNVYGLRNASVKVVSGSSESEPTQESAPETEETEVAEEGLSEKELNKLSADDLKELAETMGVEYTNKKDTVERIIAL